MCTYKYTYVYTYVYTYTKSVFSFPVNDIPTFEKKQAIQLSMLRAILNKSWRQHPTRHQLYGHLPPITKTIQVRRTRHVGHC